LALPLKRNADFPTPSSAVRSERLAEAERTAAVEPDGGSKEINYGSPAGDFAALARDRIEVRTLAAEDTATLLRIDRRITGRDATRTSPAS
jgi:hypothetical protein